MEERRCIKCGEVICEGRARFFIPPYSDMCNKCRAKEIILRGVRKKINR